MYITFVFFSASAKYFPVLPRHKYLVYTFALKIIKAVDIWLTN